MMVIWIYLLEKKKNTGILTESFYNNCAFILFLFNIFYRPFARRLPEFKFWYACTRSTVIAFFMTFFEVFDVPVFWPILLLYFIVLFFITMKRQIRHMIKHRYVPWSWGKLKYAGNPAAAKSAE